MEDKIWFTSVFSMVGLQAHPNAESLLTLPWSAWYDPQTMGWKVRSPTKPKNALVYGIVWEEVIG